MSRHASAQTDSGFNVHHRSARGGRLPARRQQRAEVDGSWCFKNDLDRRQRYGRSVTDERIPDNRPYDGLQSGDLPRAKSFRNPRQNDLPISDAFLTTSRCTSRNHASPTNSRDAPMPMKSTIDAPTRMDGAVLQTVRLGREDSLRLSRGIEGDGSAGGRGIGRAAEFCQKLLMLHQLQAAVVVLDDCG